MKNMCRDITLKRYELEFLKRWENKEIMDDTMENNAIISKICQSNIVDVDESFADTGYIIVYVKVYRFYFKIGIERKAKEVINPFNDESFERYDIERVFPYRKVAWFSNDNYIDEYERKSDLSTYINVFGDDGFEPKLQTILYNQELDDDERKLFLKDGETTSE